MRRLTATLVAALTTAPAFACINDREVESHEREFKSSYQFAPKPAEPPPSPADHYPAVATAGGVALLLGAGVLTFRRPTGRW
ncbi:MAG: hypothetical protein U0746_09190 [Gemmataceae bacterium]